MSSEYHRGLVAKVPGDDVLKVLEDQMFWLCELASYLSTDQVDQIHPKYSWTIRQVMAHVIESERVFAFRLQHAAAGDKKPLPGFDQDEYAEARYGLGPFSNLITELAHLRKATLMMLARIKPKCWNQRITADSAEITLRGLAWVLAGHLHHHFEIIENRCGFQVQRGPDDCERG
ncbi:MAG: DinB family protein [Planctomycetota bacterium]